MAHGVEQFVGLSLVVVDSRAVAPAVRGEIQRHHEILFAIGRGGFFVGRAVGLARPREVSERRMLRIADVHVALGPIPQRVEFFFPVELHCDHHAVRHAFGSDIVVVPIGQIGEWPLGVLSGREVHGLRFWVAVE
jgi:hypothetical protein